jgi:branched-chain amino acid transport system ATP-binding protein
VLHADDVRVRYGAVAAVRGVSLTVAPGSALAVLGPNGAGKSSLLRAVSGLVRHAGDVAVDDAAIATPDQAVTHGIVHVPQGRGLFRRLTVRQNLELAVRGKREARARALASATERIGELRTWWNRRVGTLSGGEQVLVALGRLIAAEPSYALVDELSLGLAPIARDRVDEELRRLRDDGIGLVVVDQHAPRALAIADEVLVLERGAVAFAGPARRADPSEIAALALGVGR